LVVALLCVEKEFGTNNSTRNVKNCTCETNKSHDDCYHRLYRGN